MLEQTPFRIGMIGVGAHGTEILLPALRNIPNVEVVGLCDLSESRLHAAADLVPTAATFASYHTMFDKAIPTAVVIAGPPQLHYSAALAAAERGIHPFVEKPPTVSTEDLVDLAKRCTAAGVITGVGLNFRYSTPVQLVADYIRWKGLHPIYVSVKHTSSKPRQGLWGLERLKAFLLAQAMHPLDTMLYLCGPAESVHADWYVAPDDLTLSISIRFKNMSVGHLLTGSDSPKFENVLEVITAEDVVFRLDNMWQLSVLDERALPDGVPDAKRWSLSWAPSPLSSGFARAGYLRELATFTTCVAAGKSFSPAFADALPIYALLDEIQSQIAAGNHLTPEPAAVLDMKGTLVPR